jgi:hypothetical protein
VIIEPGYWLDHGVQINHLPTARGFGEGQGALTCPGHKKPVRMLQGFGVATTPWKAVQEAA